MSKDPKDDDARLGAESRRLLDDMNALISRAKLLLLDRVRPAVPEVPAMPVSPGTLGAILYSHPQEAVATESEWRALVRAIAAGDRSALHALGERTQGVARTLIERITGRPDIAEQLTVDVLQEVSQQAEGYDATRDGTVLGWIMNLTRAKALAARGDPNQTLSLLAGPGERWSEPPWEAVAPGISVKLLAADTEKQMVSMLVRLAPATDYPPHTHRAVEELHLLEGELWIDERKLRAGEYYRAEPGSADKRVWSETGCSCVLITSTQDLLT
ncbi:MAG TPA: cupin domain-containing protein [Burkholderiales bacterium]|nr:cupin domain-containing protein [Burkholderiales bacterium]